MHQSFETTFPERLKQAIGDQSVRAFARSCQLSDTVVRQYLSGQSEPTRPALIAMAKASSKSLNWLMLGYDPTEFVDPSMPISTDLRCPPTESINSKDYHLLKQFPVVLDHPPVLFHREWLQQEFGTSNDFQLLYMPDDSMEPTLKVGNLLLVRLQSATYSGIHALNLFGTIMVKRLQQVGENTLRVLSDSNYYESFSIDRSQAQSAVIGQVVLSVNRLPGVGVSDAGAILEL